jgi:hypothetical protein
MARMARLTTTTAGTPRAPQTLVVYLSAADNCLTPKTG